MEEEGHRLMEEVAAEADNQVLVVDAVVSQNERLATRNLKKEN
jgi:hypothetical protein